MKKEINISFSEYSSVQDTSKIVQSLFERAFEARKVAYAPYSNFLVGCAILMNNGEIVIGNNQENASFPVGICAERVALTSASAQFPNQKISTLAIVAGKDMNNDKAIAPCGICRQTILEYELKQKSPIEIYFMGTTGKVIQFDSAKNLLPFCFDGSLLI